MLKSIFAKYVTTFMALLLASFLLLLFIVNTVFSNDSLRAEQEAVGDMGTACVEQLTALLDESDEGSFDALFADGNGSLAGRLMQAAMTHSQDMTVYVTDTRGGFIFSTGKSATATEPGTLLMDPATLPETMPSEDESGTPDPGVFLASDAYGTPAESLIYVCPVPADAEDPVGYVIITSTAESRNTLMETTLRSVAVAGLWIMLAALVAIYFTTERVTGPLREMSRASKRLMVGQFDVRVRVHGRDEVAELAVAFNQMAGALENLDRMRNSFVANVSHDLRTPMTTISGFIDGILDGVIPPEEQAHYLKVVSDEVRRLSRLVTALLDVSRLQAGDRKFDKKPFDVCEMGRQILISFEQKIEDKRLNVEFDCDEERMFVLADRDAIHQILYNICDNAVKFAYAGGKLRMSFAWSSGTHAGRKAMIRVYNEGPGIPAEDQPFVFERFYKSDKSRSLDKTGVGLGMFIAKTIIEAHGETISVASVPGTDCEFTFTLPRTDPPRTRSLHPTEESTHERNRTK